MSIVTLVEAQPRVAADGSAVTVSLVANARRRADFGGVQSQPKLADVPGSEVSLGFDGRSFSQGAAPAVSPIGITLDAQTAPWAKLVWKGAPVTVKTAPWAADGGDPADTDFATAFIGRADGATVKGSRLSVAIVDAGQPLRAPLEPLKGGATGDALLDGADAVSIAGRPLPRGWGQLEAVPGELVDKARLIYLFLAKPAANVQGFEDGGYPFTLGVARASLAALRATAPAAGCVDYCLDAGGLVLARPWTTPTYPFTANLTTAQTKIADIVAAIIAERTALTMAAGTVAAFNALQGAAARLTPEQVEGKTIAEALDQLLAGVGGWWRLTSAGTIELGRWAYAAPAVTFAAHQVVSIERQATVMPTVERTLGYRRNGKVHGDGDIAKALLISGVDGLSDALTIMSSDAWLSQGEKPEAIRQYTDIYNRQPLLDAAAAALGITTERTAAQTKYTALGTLLAGLTPTWSDVTTDTPIAGSTFSAAFTDYRSAAETLDAKIKAVLKSRADQGIADASTASAAIAVISADGWLSKGEKPEAIRQYTDIYNSYPIIDAQAAALGITTERTAVQTKYTALGTLLGALSPDWSDVTVDTPVTASTFSAAFTDYRAAAAALDAKIKSVTKARADQGVTDAASAQITASAAAADAADASSAAATASSDAQAGVALAADVTDNNKLGKGDEKKRLAIFMSQMSGDVPAFAAQLTSLGLTSRATSLTAAYNAFLTYLNGLGGTSPNYAWLNIGTTTSIVRTSFNTYLLALTNELSATATELAAKAATLAVTTGITSATGVALSDATLINGRTEAANLFTDAHFDNFPKTTDWAYVSYGSPILTAQAASDGRRLLFDSAGGAAVGIYAQAGWKPCRAGDRIDGSVEIYMNGASAGSYLGLYVYFYDGGGALVGGTGYFVGGAYAYGGTAYGWQQLASSIDVPNDATIAFAGVGILGYMQAGSLAYARGPNAYRIEKATQLLTVKGRGKNRRQASSFASWGSGVVYSTSGILSATTTSSGVSSIAIAAHTINDDAGSIGFTAGSIGGLSPSTRYYIYEDNPDYSGGARSYVATSAQVDLTGSPSRRFVDYVDTPATPASGTSPPSAGGGIPGGRDPLP